MKNDLKRNSKFLSFILRHNPQEIGLELDENGWAVIEELIERSALHGKVLSKELIEKIVITNDKQRFSICERGLKIRANQGHSISVNLDLKNSVPPVALYHGTSEKNLGLIMSQGLQKMQRHHVHLTESKVTAISVGERYGKPVLLSIDTKRMYEDKVKFFKSDNNVWLVDHIPPEYIEIISRLENRE